MLCGVFAQIIFYTNLSIYYLSIFFPLLRTLMSSLEFSEKLSETDVLPWQVIVINLSDGRKR